MSGDDVPPDERFIMTLLALGWPGPFELLILAGLGLLIFGKRLPEVGRSIGKTIVEFKKGMKEVETEIYENDEEKSPADSPRKSIGQTAKFDPYTGKPLQRTAETVESKAGSDQSSQSS